MATAKFHPLTVCQMSLQRVYLYISSTFSHCAHKQEGLFQISGRIIPYFIGGMPSGSSHFPCWANAWCWKGKSLSVGGWAIRKVLEKSRRFVQSSIHTENEETMRSVRLHHAICELIEESLIGSLLVLEQASQHKETLQVMEAHQYWERALIHIEDAAYCFFMALESQRT